jgi:putative zinc finger/helix-turn-helix YgiT family protein
MAAQTESLAYVACGLPHVTLVGVEVRRCAACGEHEVVIPKIEQLHRVIAHAVITQRARLTGAEVRFLRKYLGWSGVDFARHMGVTAESVSRWENDREPMSPTADRLVRLMVVTREPVSSYSLDELVDLDLHAAPIHLEVEPKRGGWHARVAA